MERDNTQEENTFRRIFLRAQWPQSYQLGRIMPVRTFDFENPKVGIGEIARSWNTTRLLERCAHRLSQYAISFLCGNRLSENVRENIICTSFDAANRAQRLTYR